MSKKTWILISCLVLSLTLGLGGSLAYLTDTDTKVNTFTMGNVDIEVYEPTGQDYSGMMPGVMVDKQAQIKNTGANDAYVFMTVAVPQEVADFIEINWNEMVIENGDGRQVWLSDGKPAADGREEERYDVYDKAGRGYKVETFVWYGKLAQNEETKNLLVGVTLNEWVNIVDGKYYYMEDGRMEEITGLADLKVIVTGHAIQADGHNSWEAAYDAYMGQWSEWTLDVAADTVGKTYTSSATINEHIVLPTGTEDSKDDCVVATGEDTVLTINGGLYDIGTNYMPCAVWAKGGATVEIHGGQFLCDARNDLSATKHIDLIYAGASDGTTGTIIIYNGTFEAEGSDKNNPGAWLLNAKDGLGKIIVRGGDFLNWNPADNASEGPGNNFVDDGYQVWREDDGQGNYWYRVRRDSDEVFEREWDNPEVDPEDRIVKVWPVNP